MADTTNHGHPPHGQHEKTDLEVIAVTKYGIGILLGTVLTMVLVAFLYFQADKYFKANAAKVDPMVTADPHKEPPEPRLIINEPANLKEVQAKESTILNSYGWVDPDGGKVRIPISRAMELVAKEGLPSKGAPALAPPAPKPAEAPKH